MELWVGRSSMWRKTDAVDGVGGCVQCGSFVWLDKNRFFWWFVMLQVFSRLLLPRNLTVGAVGRLVVTRRERCGSHFNVDFSTIAPFSVVLFCGFFVV